MPARPKMISDALKSQFAMDCEARYDFTLDALADEREFWILVNDERQFLKIYSEEYELEYVPIWPSKELAEFFCDQDEEDSLQSKCVSLPEFLKKWVSGLQRDGIEIGVFPGNDSTVWLTSPEEFKQDLQDVLDAF